MKIPPNTLVVVADGGRQLMLENKGSEAVIDLRVIDKETLDTPRNKDLDKAAPGKFPTSLSGHGSGEGRDSHELAETQFSKSLVEKVTRMLSQTPQRKLVIICDPDTLGEIRKSYTPAIRKALLADIASDLTGHPTTQIEEVLKMHVPRGA